ncbi:hypothetical protein ACKI1J_11550 [Streptomyces scabiei]|uniref:hypothetical protein n=1 Tax=Streptomyces scabiei TaxID=1930 RepID=UPI0038F7D017
MPWLVAAVLAVRQIAVALGTPKGERLTVLAIVATGNHWVFDAAGGAVVVGAGFALTCLLAGPRTALGKDDRKTGEGLRRTAVSGPPDPVRG